MYIKNIQHTNTAQRIVSQTRYFDWSMKEAEWTVEYCWYNKNKIISNWQETIQTTMLSEIYIDYSANSIEEKNKRISLKIGSIFIDICKILYMFFFFSCLFSIFISLILCFVFKFNETLTSVVWFDSHFNIIRFHINFSFPFDLKPFSRSIFVSSF